MVHLGRRQLVPSVSGRAGRQLSDLLACCADTLFVWYGARTSTACLSGSHLPCVHSLQVLPECPVVCKVVNAGMRLCA